jgi:NAD(P)-dependent dehydrogenase (short-subunit alcohol dehydrogenase family)
MSKQDINTIPYDAPLSIPEPPAAWIRTQGRKALSRENLHVTDVDLSGKWIVITGANSGIGREATLQFAKWGANIILGCRQNSPPHEPSPSSVVTECREAAKEKSYHDSLIEWWHIDMADLSSVEAFAARYLETGRPIDILCNTAGIGSSPKGAGVFKTRDGFEIFHQINFISHVLLTLHLLPAVAKAEMPRITCTVSSMHYNGEFNVMNFNGELNRPGRDGVQFYSNNKLWFQTWLTELQRRLLQHKQYKHITINGVHPGFVNSEIWNLTFESWSAPLKIAFYKTLAYLFAIDSQQGSLCILHGATAIDAGPNPQVQGVGVPGGRGGGQFYARTSAMEPMPHAKDPDCRNRVWRKVNDELKLQEKGLLDVLGLEYTEKVRKASPPGIVLILIPKRFLRNYRMVSVQSLRMHKRDSSSQW